MRPKALIKFAPFAPLPLALAPVAFELSSFDAFVGDDVEGRRCTGEELFMCSSRVGDKAVVAVGNEGVLAPAPPFSSNGR